MAAAVESGNVQLAATAEHLELSLVRAALAHRPVRRVTGVCSPGTLRDMALRLLRPRRRLQESAAARERQESLLQEFQVRAHRTGAPGPR